MTRVGGGAILSLRMYVDEHICALWHPVNVLAKHVVTISQNWHEHVHEVDVCFKTNVSPAPTYVYAYVYIEFH